MPKRDPQLRNFQNRPRPRTVDKWARGRPRRKQAQRAKAAPGRVNVLLELEERMLHKPLTALKKLDFVEHGRAVLIVSGDLPSNRIGDLEDVDGVKRVELSRPLSHDLDAALPEARVAILRPAASPEHRGAGVIIGIIDSGIDFTHESFLRNGKTRVLRLWDQSLTPKTGEHRPDGFQYGVEYTQEEIDAALAGGQELQHKDDPPFHGTRVAGVAAGNGEPVSAPLSNGRLRFVGVAPDADLIVVATTRGDANDPGPIGDSADTFDAVKYILDQASALKRPVAINLSLGDNMGPHDGTSLLEMGIANLITGPGRVLIKSAGNEGAQNHHAEGVLTDGAPQDVTIAITPPDPLPGKKVIPLTELAVEIWYPGQHRIALRISPPGGGAPSSVPLSPFEGVIGLSNGNMAAVNADLDDPGNHDNRTHVELLAGANREIAAGVWTFRLEGTGPWDAWIQRDLPAAFAAPFVSAAKTVSTPGTTTAVVTVGSYVNDTPYARHAPGTLSLFSGRGPTRDGRQVPTLTATGEEVMTSQPAPVYFGPFRGTSVSAPLVTGAAALMLEANPTLTAAQIKRILEQTASPDPQTTAPDNAWGFGKLDIERACRYAQKLV